ncbi:response regulator [Geovibrio ferrireducens]|uniref:response regulator n=1 Tax=Geovibrio ferrireducens TaxID=46201 RepID=UPI002246E24C|nr:response regulator [Geovibrio ferrireducens]
MKDISVLIVEDDPAVAGALELRMKRTFSRVYSAHDGRKGLETALAVRPDVILTDLRMPHMEGLDMIEEIRKSLPDVHVIVLTASSDRFDRNRAEELGVEGYFTKPLMVNELIAKIQELV